MKIICPTCGATLKLPEEAIGKTCRCPKCANKFIAEGEPDKPAFELRESAASVSQTPPLPAPVEVQYQELAAPPIPMQTCPFCAEQIPQSAKKCKYCRETLDVALRAAEEAQRTASKGSNQQQVVIHQDGGDHVYRRRRRQDFPHLIHLVVSVFTCGAWLPVWLIHRLIWEYS